MASLGRDYVSIRVLIDREVTLPNGMKLKINDALYYTPAEYQAMTDADVVAAMIDRAQAHAQSIKDTIRRVPTKAERLARLAEMNAELASQQAEVDALPDGV